MKLTETCHNLVRPYIKPDAIVVDATLGNGYDSLFLCQSLDRTGYLYGFDIQADAISNTKKLLSENDFDNFKLYQKSHHYLQETLLEESILKVDVIMFNFGYLPKGDHSITTKAETSMKAIEQSIKILKSDGIISLMLYPGHPEGAKESQIIQKFLSELSDQHIEFKQIRTDINQESDPYLIIISKD